MSGDLPLLQRLEERAGERRRFSINPTPLYSI
jgi:hypothetical protein